MIISHWLDERAFLQINTFFVSLPNYRTTNKGAVKIFWVALDFSKTLSATGGAPVEIRPRSGSRVVVTNDLFCVNNCSMQRPMSTESLLAYIAIPLALDNILIDGLFLILKPSTVATTRIMAAVHAHSGKIHETSDHRLQYTQRKLTHLKSSGNIWVVDSTSPTSISLKSRIN